MRANYVSNDEALLSRVQRAFKAVDCEQYGYIMAVDLEKVLRPLQLVPTMDESSVGRCLLNTSIYEMSYALD